MSARITATGRAITVNRIRGLGTEPVHVGWGTGTVAPVDGDTALGTAAPEARVTGTPSIVTTTTTNDTHRVVGTIAATAARAITEVGVFDAATAGNMFIRATFPAINVVSGDSIQFTISGQYLAP